MIDVSTGRSPADFVIRGGTLVNVNTAETYLADVAVKGDRIAFVGNVNSVDGIIGSDTRIIDAAGKYLLPGFIDTHVHTWESWLKIDNYARSVMPHGTTAIVCDYYGPGLFLGPKAIRFEINAAKKTPLKVFFSSPMGSGFYQGDPFSNNETLREKEQVRMLSWPETHGVNEIMPEKVAEKDPPLLRILKLAEEKGRVIYGHAPGSRGNILQAWMVGVKRIADHECMTVDEAIEKARLGVWISVREAGVLSNVDLVKAITDKKVDPRHFMFCSDIGDPVGFKVEGHLDNNLREAVGYGLDPVTAVQMATINAAEYMRMDHEIGSVAPGKIADIVLADDLRSFRVSLVIANGEVVAKDGQFTARMKQMKYPRFFYGTVKLKKTPRPEDFQIKAPKGKDRVTVRVIGLLPNTANTEERRAVLEVKDGLVMPDPENDIAKIVVFERYRGTGEIGRGFVQGFKMRSGAVGSTYYCQQSDLFVIGTNDDDMALAAREIVKMGGGFIAVEDGKVLAKLALPLAGLLADEPLEATLEKLEKVNAAANRLGSFGKYPFLSLIAPPMPVAHFTGLKITRTGYTTRWKMVPLVAE